jgi:uncharacterized protein YbaP (TraB family)
MKKFLLVLLSLYVVMNSDAQVPTEKALLWKVTGNGLKEPSYLFGTFHLVCPGEFKMPAVVKEKLLTTRQLYLEIDMDDPNMMTEMMKGMQMHDTTTLKQLLANDYDTINKVFKGTTGFGLEMFNKAKPFLLMSMIYPSMLGCQPISLEGEFMKIAHDKKMQVNGLETLTDQVNVFEKIPYSVQADMLVKTLYNMDSSKASFNELEKIYSAKDINKMYEITTSDKDFGEYEGFLLDNRNKNWIPVIGQQAKKMPTFFAFGAGHLGGKEGVINLLRKSGFKVTPVYY